MNNNWRICFLISITALIFVSSASLYLYGRTIENESRYDTLLSKLGEVAHKVNLLINFDNGTKIWYNGTYVPIDSNLFHLTLKITDGDVNYTNSQYGLFINSISGVGANPVDKSRAWLWWYYNPTQEKWYIGEVGADQHILYAGEIIAWYYQDISTFPNLKTPS